MIAQLAEQLCPFLLGMLLTWVALLAAALLVVNIALVWSLSEPRRKPNDDPSRPSSLAPSEDAEVFYPSDFRNSILRLTLASTSDMESDGEEEACHRAVVRRVIAFCTSWQGQTTLSVGNHLSTMAAMLYGIIYEPEYQSLIPVLIVAVAASGFGLFVSAMSLCARTYPQFKLTPSDDSFRVACVIKTGLVMLKAGIVFELGNIDSDSLWETVVIGLFFSSFLVMAIVTLAFSIGKIWWHPNLLRAAGEQHPRRFLVRYVISYVAVKLGTLLLMAARHAPDWFGCTTVPRCYAHDGRGIGPICTPDRYGRDYGACNQYSYSVCGACKSRFSGGSPPTMVQFLSSLLWMPFSVYNNNETARFIDGLWWNHLRQRASQQQENGGQDQQIGLSTAQHGIRAVAPLVEAVVATCAAVSYGVYVSGGSDGVLTWTVGLNRFMVGSVLSVNGLMSVRLLIGCVPDDLIECIEDADDGAGTDGTAMHDALLDSFSHELVSLGPSNNAAAGPGPGRRLGSPDSQAPAAAAAREGKSAAAADVSGGGMAASRRTERPGEAGDGQSMNEQRLKAEAAERLNRTRAEAEKLAKNTCMEAERELKAAAVAAAAASEPAAETAKQASANDDAATAAAEKAPT
eukprot:SAG22_NODE_49_length_24620_cov_80.053587_24_plen_629_part_00